MFLQVLVKVIVVYLTLEPLDCIFFKYCIHPCILGNTNIISASLYHVVFWVAVTVLAEKHKYILSVELKKHILYHGLTDNAFAIVSTTDLLHANYTSI